MVLKYIALSIQTTSQVKPPYRKEQELVWVISA